MSSDNVQSPQTSGHSVEGDLPEQHHAGKVGYGPNYKAGPSMEDKISGLKEELVGKVTRKPERVQHGHEIMSGEEKRKKLEGDDQSPFANAKDDDSPKADTKSPSGPGGPPAPQSHSSSSQPGSSQTQTSPNPKSDELQLGTGGANPAGAPKANPQGMAVNQGYGKGAKEQAATVAPEGTHDAHMQRQGQAVDQVKHIG